jgi:hypothetical protein
MGLETLCEASVHLSTQTVPKSGWNLEDRKGGMNLIEFEKIFQDATHTEPNFHTGTMMILKGAVIQQWYQIVGKHRKWVRSLDPAQAYAFGVDAFETEVN